MAAVKSLEPQISSLAHKRQTYQPGPVVHEILRPALENLGFIVEAADKRGKTPGLRRAVLHGEGPALEKWFDLDGWHPDRAAGLEIEGGKALESKNALWDLMKFSVITEIEYGVIIVPMNYEPVSQAYTPPYDHIRVDFDLLYANPERFKIPLRGLLLIGY